METRNEMELIQKRISSLFQDPLCKILQEKSSFTKIQLETLLIDYLTYNTIEPKITQSSKAQARQTALGRSRGSYNRVLRQSRTKLEKTLYSILLLAYLGILGDIRSATINEPSQKMWEYLKTRSQQPTKDKLDFSGEEKPEEATDLQTLLRMQIYRLLSGGRS